MAFKSAWVTKQPTGEANMVELAGYIAEGAMAFLKAEWKIFSLFCHCCRNCSRLVWNIG